MGPQLDISKLDLKERWQAVRLMRTIRVMLNQKNAAKRRKLKKVARQNKRIGRIRNGR